MLTACCQLGYNKKKTFCDVCLEIWTGCFIIDCQLTEGSHLTPAMIRCWLLTCIYSNEENLLSCFSLYKITFNFQDVNRLWLNYFLSHSLNSYPSIFFVKHIFKAFTTCWLYLTKSTLNFIQCKQIVLLCFAAIMREIENLKPTAFVSKLFFFQLRDSPSSRSQPESIASSGNTSSTITPPRSHHSHKMTQSISSRSSRSIKSGSELFRKPPSLTEEGGRHEILFISFLQY